MDDGSSELVLHQVIRLADELGLDADRAQVLHYSNNAVVLLPKEEVVVRLARGEQIEALGAAQALCAWLIEIHGFPATAPSRGLAPRAVDGFTASFWTYCRPLHAVGQAPTSRDLAKLLRRLHNVTFPPIVLPQWTPLESLERALCDNSVVDVISEEDRSWLVSRVQEVREKVLNHDWPLERGVIHADAWAGNLLWDGPTLRLGDWDNVSIGPREVDLIPTWHAAARYGKGPAWSDAFRDVYGYDLTSGPGCEDLMAMRDLVQLSGPLGRARHDRRHLEALRQRLGDIRADRSDTVWSAMWVQ